MTKTCTPYNAEPRRKKSPLPVPESFKLMGEPSDVEVCHLPDGSMLKVMAYAPLASGSDNDASQVMAEIAKLVKNYLG